MQSLTSNTISIIYKTNTYEVNQSLLCHASKRFSEFIYLYNQNIEAEKPKLEILNQNFSERNIENFLKICQNLPTDVQNWEIQEICEIALMFQAYEIYQKAISFIRSNIDQNFSINENKYNQCTSNYFNLASTEKLGHHNINFADLEFESDESIDENHNNFNNNDGKIMNNITNDQYQYSKEPSIIYLIKEEVLSRGQRFLFLKNNKAIMSAKIKGNKIYFTNKTDTNFDTNSLNFIPRIEREQNLNNQVILNNQKFNIKYILGNDSNYLIETSFQFADKTYNWFSKDDNMKSNRNEYKRLISGMHNHSFRKSNKNIALQDKDGNIEFIVRKVGHNSYEAECNPNISEIIAFSIAVSQIVGPFFNSIDAFQLGNENVVPRIAFSIT